MISPLLDLDESDGYISFFTFFPKTIVYAIGYEVITNRWQNVFKVEISTKYSDNVLE